MAKPKKRAKISVSDIASISSVDPTAGVQGISGVRVHDIGQGDSISVLSERGIPFMQIDYGGRVGNPFRGSRQVDRSMPVAHDKLLMLSHWDEDHWCSAAKGTLATSATWLVPRQTTSPRAVKFSLTVPKIYCVPESRVGRVHVFTTAQGDEIWWEKIAAAPVTSADSENCNRTGIAFSIVKNGRDSATAQVILLPGDAAFGEVRHFREHRAAGRRLRGLVAFHHGTNQHWTPGTRVLLEKWKPTVAPVDVVFSCALQNSYGHPHKQVYSALPFPRKLRTTPGIRRSRRNYYDVLF